MNKTKNFSVSKLKRVILCVISTIVLVAGLSGCNLKKIDPTDVGGTWGTRLDELCIADKAENIFVVVQDEDSTYCTFYSYEKKSDVWVEEFETRGYLGRSGIIQNATDRKAGDGTTPGGVYLLAERFGIYDKPVDMDGTYHKVTEDDYWNGDGSSDSYNQLVQGSKMPADWNPNSSEHLIEYQVCYKYCAMINFNVDPVVPGKGSCIFLHCDEPGTTNPTTAGCVSIPLDMMERTLVQMGDDTSYIVILRHAEDFDMYKDFVWQG